MTDPHDFRPAIQIEPDDGQPVDEEHVQALMADGRPQAGADLGPANTRLRACTRPARCWWVDVP